MGVSLWPKFMQSRFLVENPAPGQNPEKKARHYIIKRIGAQSGCGQF